MSEVMKNKRLSPKKLTILVVLAALLLVLIGGVLFYIFSPKGNGSSSQKELVDAYYNAHRLEFSDPGTAVSPEDDTDYIENYSRVIMYEQDPVTVEISEEFPPEDEAANIALQFVLATMRGDAINYNLLFTEEYLRENGRQAPFHAQKIYNIRIVRGSRSSDASSCRFEVRYSIKDNDATLRRDVVSHMERPLILTVEKTERGYRISSLAYVFRNS